MHRTSRRQARQDHGCRNVPRGHDEQTQRLDTLPRTTRPTVPDSGSAAEATASGRGRCDARQIATSQDLHPVTRSLAPGDSSSRASEQGRRTTQCCPTCGSISDRLVHAAYRLVSCDVPSSRSDHRSESPTAAERADTSKRSRSPAPSRLSAVAGRERASARGWPASGGARLLWQRRR
jgi:hypothetical protein